jgi:alpha-tubulin suppressor-like RCC1 family protein
MFVSKENSQKGSTLLLVSMMISFLMVMALAVAQVILIEVRMGGDFASTQKAFYGKQAAFELSFLNRANSSGTLFNSTQFLGNFTNPFTSTFLFNSRGLSGVVRRDDDTLFVKPKVTAAFIHSLALKTNGAVFGVGNGQYGSFGTGEEWPEEQKNGWQYVSLSNIVDISTGMNHTIALDRDGRVWSTGDNSMGQLGLGLSESSVTSWQKANITDVKDIETWELHGFALKNDGTLMGAGEQYGMGTGSLSGEYNTWTTLPINNVQQVSAGTWHSVVLKNDGTVWGAGEGMALGLNSNTDYANWVQLPVVNAKKVIAGYSNTFVLKNDGTLWVTGYNRSGQLGLGDTTDRLTWVQSSQTSVIDFDLGACNSILLKNDGNVYMAGCYSNGTSGNSSFWNLASSVDSIVSVTSGQDQVFAIKYDGTVYALGSNRDCELGTLSACNPNDGWANNHYTFKPSLIKL